MWMHLHVKIYPAKMRTLYCIVQYFSHSYQEVVANQIYIDLYLFTILMFIKHAK